MYPACILEISTHKNRSEKNSNLIVKLINLACQRLISSCMFPQCYTHFRSFAKNPSNPVRRHGTSPDHSHKSVRIKRLPHKFRKPVQIPFSGHVIKISGKDVPGKAVYYSGYPAASLLMFVMTGRPQTSDFFISLRYSLPLSLNARILI